MMRFLGRSCVFVLAAALLMTPQLTLAQTNVSTGQILGVATDPDDLYLPGATVTARNVNTGLSRADVTDTSGFFRLDLLPSGIYDVRLDLPGFASLVQKDVEVTLGSAVRVDFQVQMTAIEEEIVVTATAQVVETTNPSVASSVSDTMIANLPLNGRDFLDFVALTPASIPGDSGRVHVGGMRGIQNSFNIDGSNSQSSFFGEERGGTRPPFTFSQAAIKEFQVLTSSYNLQFGNASGGIINAITKSGTNDFQGEIFWYYRPDSFVSDYADERSSSDFNRDQFGATLGGPIVRDRLHFFVSYDGQKMEQPTNRYFRGFPDDRTAEWEALTGLSYANEVGSIVQTNDNDSFLVKLDWQISDNHLLSVRDNYNDQEGENLTSGYSTGGWSNNGFEQNSFNSLVVNLTSVLTEDLFNELIVQIAHEERPRAANYTSIPEVRLGSSYDATFGQNQFLPNTLDEDRWQVIDNLTWFMGKHTFKAGFNVDFVGFDDYFPRYANGQYYYRSWDQFFDDDLYRYTQAFSDYDFRVKYDTDYQSYYVQDEWRAKPNLTVTYGMRWDMQHHDNPKETNPLYPATGDIPDDDDNYAPRVGFAWDVEGDGKQVVRGGIGYFFDNTPVLLDANAMLTNGVRVVRIVSSCAYGPCPSWPNTWDSLEDLDAAAPSIFVFSPDFENPETLRMSLGYEVEVASNFSMGVDLIYSSTEKLERKQDQNIHPDGGETVDGRPTYYDPWGNPLDPNFSQIMMFKSDAKANYKAVVLKARKRYSNGWMLDASYTFSRARDTDSNERSVSSTGSGYGEDQYNLSGDWGPSDYDVKHKFVASAAVALPYDFTVSAILFIRSGFPFTANDGRDLNTDGYYHDRATWEIEPGVFYHYPRNSFRDGWYRNLDLRVAKTFRLMGDFELEIIAEVFNVLDNENWTTTEDTLVIDEWWSGNTYLNPDFGAKTDSGNPRQYQLGLKFRF